MKKLLITLTILFSSLFLIDNVSAYCSNFPTLSSNNAIVMNTYGYSKDDILDIVNKGFYSGGGLTQTNFIINSIFTLRNYYEINLKNEYDYYFISYYAVSNASSSNGYAIPEFRLNVFNENDIDSSIKDYILNSHNHYNENKKTVLSLNINSVVNKTYYSYSTGNNYNQLNFSNIVSNVNYVINVAPSNSGSNYSVYYETNYNTNLYLNENDNSNIYNLLSYDGVSYAPGQLICNTKDGLGVPMTKPKIEISEVDSSYINVNSPLEGQSFKTSATYNVSFSIFDENLYNYYYSKDSTNWINIGNDFQFDVLKNGTYYFKITDKENNSISATSLDISTLKSLDYVKVKLSVDDLIENNGSIDFMAVLNNDDNLKAKPYIESFYYDNGKYIEIREEIDKEDETFSYNLIQDLNTTVYYNYVLDLIDYYENIDFSFDPKNSVGFEIVYYFSDGQVLTTGLEEYISPYPENYNLVKLDLSNSSGIMIVPKNYSTNDIFSNFYGGDIHHVGLFGIYLNGNFRIRNYTKNGYLRLTSDSNNKNFYYGNAEFIVDNNVGYPFPTDLGYLIIKQESDMGSRGDSSLDYIILDTERFVYKIMQNDSDVPTINNPNNENITITGPSINDSDIEDNILNSSTSKDYEDNVGSITDYINSISNTLNFVKDVLELGFNSLPFEVRGFMIFIFNILCIFMILRIGGYLG